MEKTSQNVKYVMLIIMGIIIGSRLEIMAQQNNWTQAVCSMNELPSGTAIELPAPTDKNSLYKSR